MTWNEMKSALEKRADEIKMWDVEKRKHPVWDDFLTVMQLGVAVEKQLNRKCKMTDEGNFCPECGEKIKILHPLNRFCAWCGQKLEWSELNFDLHKFPCEQPEEEVTVFLFKDNYRYSEDVVFEMGGEVFNIPRGKFVKVKRKALGVLREFYGEFFR